MPSFLVADPSTLKLAAAVSNINMRGIKNLQLKGSLNPYLYKIFDFTLDIVPYSKPPPPKFSAGFKTKISVNVGNKLTYNIPPPYNPINNRMTVDVTSDGSSTLPSFIEYDDAA